MAASLPSRLTALLVAAALIAGLASGCGNRTNEAKRAAIGAACPWLTDIDNGQYAQGWLETSAFLRNAVPEQKWSLAIAAVRKPLGDLKWRNLKSAQYATKLPGAPDGQYVVLRFDTSFANRKSAIETVTFMLDKDGQWRSVRYLIK